MDYTKKLQEINDEYYPIIKKMYKNYVKHFKKIPNLTKNVFILSDDECIGEHNDLLKKRGKCVTENGYIYIRESKFNKHVLIHEFIHRLSRNYLDCGWVEGIGVEVNIGQGIIDYSGLNEVLTEWFAYEITKYRETTIYQDYLPVIDGIITNICSLKSIKSAFFKGDIGYFFDVFANISAQKNGHKTLTLEDNNYAIDKINNISKTISDSLNINEL